MVFKNFKSTYKLLLLVTIVSMSFMSCGNDDSIDPSLLVTNYEEPFLNFFDTQEEFIAANGTPESVDIFGDGTHVRFYYNQGLNGVEHYSYDFITGSGSPDIPVYFDSNVKVPSNQQNLAFLKSALTDIYGEPDFLDGDLTNSPHAYLFQVGGSHSVSLIFSRNIEDPNSIMVVAYTAGD